MTALFVVLGLLAFILLLLFLPLTVDFSYANEVYYRFKFAGFILFDSEKKVSINKIRRKKKNKKAKGEKSQVTIENEESFFKKTYHQRGIIGTIKYFTNVLVIILKKFLWVIKHFKFKKFNLDITIASENAANTAIEYGSICACVYPVLSLLESATNFKVKKINIGADFDKTVSSFEICFSVKTQLFYWLIAAILALFEFLKLQRKDSENNE